MHKTIFSVVIPLYNKGLHIERALSSVLAQTVQALEVIVIDDGSTDDGAETVKGFNGLRIHLIRQKNAGVSAARNRGIAAAKGELVAFLDADDEWKPEFLEIMLRLRYKYPDAGMFAAAYDIRQPNGRIKKMVLKAVPPAPWEGLLPNYFRSATLGDHPVWSSAVSIPTRIFSEIEGFPVGERLGEDLDVFGRIAMKYPIAFSRQTGAVYCLDATNRALATCTIGETLPFIRTAQKALEEGLVSERMTADLKEYIAKMKLIVARDNILSGNPERAMRALQGCRTSHFHFRKLWYGLWAMMPAGLTRLVWSAKWKILGMIFNSKVKQPYSDLRKTDALIQKRP